MATSSEAFNGRIAPLINALSLAGDSLLRNEAGAREKLLALSYSLSAALELPSEAIQRIGWAEPARFACIRTAVDLKLFDVMVKHGENGISAAQLAAESSADEVLIARMLKHMAAMNVVMEIAIDQYAPTHLSKAFVEPKYRDGITYCHDVAGPSFRSIPAYLKQTQYKCPTDIANGPFQYAHNTKLPFFAWLGENPSYFECFNNYMSGYRAGKPSWADSGCYPVEERLVCDKTSNDEVLIVDVGGGMGHDLKALREKHPSISGRLVLQDRKEVIDQISQGEGAFEATVHDFFKPQPIKGAKAYYLHSVLHDWDDESCVRILRQIVTALRPGYSKILINDFIVDDFQASWSATSMDWLMLALGAVRERTENQWRELAQAAGLKIVNIWTFEQGSESLMELELV